MLDGVDSEPGNGEHDEEDDDDDCDCDVSLDHFDAFLPSLGSLVLRWRWMSG